MLTQNMMKENNRNRVKKEEAGISLLLLFYFSGSLNSFQGYTAASGRAKTATSFPVRG